MHAIAFNLLGDALPAGTAGVVCTWSSDGERRFSCPMARAAHARPLSQPPPGRQWEHRRPGDAGEDRGRGVSRVRRYRTQEDHAVRAG